MIADKIPLKYKIPNDNRNNITLKMCFLLFNRGNMVLLVSKYNIF